jgi:ABC-type Mn2+/Zn2+ transport system permease subunit
MTQQTCALLLLLLLLLLPAALKTNCTHHFQHIHGVSGLSTGNCGTGAMLLSIVHAALPTPL